MQFGAELCRKSDFYISMYYNQRNEWTDEPTNKHAWLQYLLTELIKLAASVR